MLQQFLHIAGRTLLALIVYAIALIVWAAVNWMIVIGREDYDSDNYHEGDPVPGSVHRYFSWPYFIEGALLLTAGWILFYLKVSWGWLLAYTPFVLTGVTALVGSLRECETCPVIPDFPGAKQTGFTTSRLPLLFRLKPNWLYLIPVALPFFYSLYVSLAN